MRDDASAALNGPDPLLLWRRWFGNLSSWLEKRNPAQLTLLFAGLAILKSGFSFFPAFDARWSLEVFPQPLGNYDSLSYGLRSVAFLLGIGSDSSLLRLSAVSLIFVAILFSVLVWRKHEKRVSVSLLAIVFLGPVGAVLLSNIGRHDVLVLSGALLLGLWGFKWTAACVATLLMLAGNPEQAVVITLCFLALTWTPAAHKYRGASYLSVALALLGFGLMWVTSYFLEVPSRLSVLDDYLRESFVAFFSNVPLLLYSGLGIGFFIVALACTAMPLRGAILVIFSTLVIPLAFTLVTADQTRVLVPLTAAQVLALSLWLLPQIFGRIRGPNFAVPTLIVVASLLLPSVVIQYPGTVRSPYAEIVFRVSGERVGHESGDD